MSTLIHMHNNALDFKYYESLPISIKKLSDNGKIPECKSDFAAGYDLFAAEDGSIEPLSRKLIQTNIAISIPNGYYGRIAPRSGLAYKNGIDVMAGVIDSDYRGDVGVILFNTSKDSVFHFKNGDRIAQIIFEKCHSVFFNITNELDATVRSVGGYGHTGI